jgi:hypothetical protein
LTILKKWQNCLKEKRKFIFSVILFVKNLKILWKRKMQNLMKIVHLEEMMEKVSKNYGAPLT